MACALILLWTKLDRKIGQGWGHNFQEPVFIDTCAQKWKHFYLCLPYAEHSQVLNNETLMRALELILQSDKAHKYEIFLYVRPGLIKSSILCLSVEYATNHHSSS